MRAFSAVVAERIGWYVYALVDPRDGSVFYVGKGTSNRVFAHATAAADIAAEPTAKLDRIRAIHAEGRDVECFIIRHGIESERQAYEIEAAVIDTFRLLAPGMSTDRFQLANAVLGHRHAMKGLAHASQVASLYDAPPAPPFDVPVLLLKIPGLWTPQMTASALYEATRGWWAIGAERRTAARYACAVNKGVIRSVYRIDSWRQRREGDRDWENDAGKPARWGFDGVPAPEMDRYVDTSVAHLFRRGDANPVKLVGPADAGRANARVTSAEPPGTATREPADLNVQSTATMNHAGAAASIQHDPLVETVAAALVRMSAWFRIEAHTARYPEGAYVQVRLDDPELGPDSALLFEATGAMYLDPPMSATQQARMRELGWDGPTDPRWMPSVNFERWVEPDAIAPGPLADFVMTTLREVFGATDADEYTFSPADLGADVVPGHDDLESFEVVEPHHVSASHPGIGLPSEIATHSSPTAESSQPPGLAGPPADPEVFGDEEPWIHHLENAWAVASRARPLWGAETPALSYPRGMLDLPMPPGAMPARRAQWSAVLHLLVYGCGWWQPGRDFARSQFEDVTIGAGRQWVVWKALAAWPGHDLLRDFLGWAQAVGDELISAALPMPYDVQKGNAELTGVGATAPPDEAASGRQSQYQKLWDGQPPDPLELTRHLRAPWRTPRNSHWRDYPSLAAPQDASDIEQPTPNLVLAVDTYEGWYLELCRRGLLEPESVLVGVHIRSLGALGTFRIGGGHRPYLVVDA